MKKNPNDPIDPRSPLDKGVKDADMETMVVIAVCVLVVIFIVLGAVIVTGLMFSGWWS